MGQADTASELALQWESRPHGRLVPWCRRCPIIPSTNTPSHGEASLCTGALLGAPINIGTIHTIFTTLVYTKLPQFRAESPCTLMRGHPLATHLNLIDATRTWANLNRLMFPDLSRLSSKYEYSGHSLCRAPHWRDGAAAGISEPAHQEQPPG